MLLTRRRRDSFTSGLCALVVFLTPVVMPACAIRPDDSWKKDGRTAVAAADADAVTKNDSGGFLGLRRDPALDIARAGRQARLAGDPTLLPSPREQRAARAMALAELEIITSGGNIMYRPDGSASREEAVRFISSPGALTLDYSASDNLNSGDGYPHALLLVVYHLSDRAAFDQLTGHTDGLRKLLAGDNFDVSVQSVRKHFMQPGAKGTLRIARPEDGRVVALVAGYLEPSADTSVFVTEYGLGVWDAPPETKLHNYRKMYTPLPIHLQATLGDTEMAVRNTGRVFGNAFDLQVFTEDQRRRHALESYF